LKREKTHRSSGGTLLQDEGAAEERRGEDNGTADERSEAELRADRSSSTRRVGSAATTGGRGDLAAGGDSTVTSTGEVGLGRTSLLGTRASETRAVTSTLLHEVESTGGDSGKLVALHGDIPGLGLGRAGGRLAVGLVTTIAAGVLGGRESVLQGGEVSELLDGVAVDLNESVVGVFLGVFVDETSGVDASHVGAVERLDLLELPGTLVATVLGEARIVSYGRCAGCWD
jgi:hypothetical protein